MLFLAEAPNTAMVVTSIRPRVSAKAVAAVRRGLRTALVRASRPTVPNTGRRPVPSTPITGRDSAGAPSSTPKIRPSAPSPISPAAPPPGFAKPPATRPAAPSRVATRPKAVRSRSELPVEANSSRIAATGAILAARRAGEYALNSVTPTPMISATSTVRGRSCRAPDGSPTLKLLSSARSP